MLQLADVTPESKVSATETRIGGQATTKINRKDFGLTWNRAIEGGGVVVGEEVEITLDIEMVKK